MRKAFTDTTHTLEDFKKHASDLDGKEGVANEAAKLMHEFNEEMEGDFRLLKRKPVRSCARLGDCITPRACRGVRCGF